MKRIVKLLAVSFALMVCVGATALAEENSANVSIEKTTTTFEAVKDGDKITGTVRFLASVKNNVATEEHGFVFVDISGAVITTDARKAGAENESKGSFDYYCDIDIPSSMDNLKVYAVPYVVYQQNNTLSAVEWGTPFAYNETLDWSVAEEKED